MRVDRRWRFAWAWCLATVLLSACASGPSIAPPFGQTVLVSRATLAVVVRDSLTRKDVEGAVVELHTGEVGITNNAGYISWNWREFGGRGITVKHPAYREKFYSLEAFTGNTQIEILIDPIVLAPSRVARALVGPLRVENKLFRDDTGFRRVFFCSWFTALRTLRDNPAEFDRQLDVIVESGYQGFRVFLAVGGWMDFWDNHEVVPITFRKWHFNRDNGGHLNDDRSNIGTGSLLTAWPDYDDLYRTMLRKVRARGLRLDVTVGDMQTIVGNDQAKELALHRRFASIAAAEGGLDVIALVEGTNEVPLNRYASTDPSSIAQLGRVLQVWRDAIPGVLTTQGAFLSEEPERLYLSVTHGQVAAVHVSRDPFELCIKRTHALTHWEGNWRHFPVPFWETEPAGPGADSYARQDNPANLTALYAMHALVGHASNYFNGPAVRSLAPLESTWGFRQLPKILAENLPENVATWEHASNGRGGIMYFSSGSHFAAATITDWDPSPPRPIAEWTLYSGDRVTSGTGTPPRVTGLLIGRFQ